MKLQKWTLAVIVPIVTALSGCTAAPPPAGPKAETAPAFKPVINVNDVMVGVIDHNSHILWDVAAPKKAPKNDAEWHELQHAAVTLAASGDVILIGGSGPDDMKWANDPQWRTLVQDMTNAALKLKLAVDNKDMKALLAAGDDLTPTCEACHAKFKPAIPAHVATKDQQPEHFYHK